MYTTSEGFPLVFLSVCSLATKSVFYVLGKFLYFLYIWKAFSLCIQLYFASCFPSALKNGILLNFNFHLFYLQVRYQSSHSSIDLPCPPSWAVFRIPFLSLVLSIVTMVWQAWFFSRLSCLDSLSCLNL